MLIYSTPTAAIQYRFEAPEIGRDWWMMEKKLLEQEYIATSTASAGFFRQIVQYDYTSIKKSYTILIEKTRTAYLQTMLESVQSSFYANIGTATFEVSIIATFAPASWTKDTVRLDFAVIRKVA